ncbi:MAG: twin-arginine translocation signal domain-containing protein [Acidobacteriota bacterium]|nr:MAG: twin-arginine translocation signal domain-containing protein [Acidobacteriota bacterium]
MKPNPENESRREFLKATAAAAVAAGTTVGGALAAAEKLPLVPFGKTQVTRLIVGANPFYGYSHFNHIFDAHMREFSTSERVLETLHRCEEQGINTWQFSYHERSVGDLKRFRDEGGKMQWICLGRPTWVDEPGAVKQAAQHGPLAISHHGWQVEQARRRKDWNQIKDMLKRIHDTGVMAGFSVHDPDVLKRSEDEGWEAEFYITSMYHMFRPDAEYEASLGERPLGEVYLPSDLEKMCAVVRQVPKPCLGIKVLAAGRLVGNRELKAKAFGRVLKGMKSTDPIIVGIYPKEPEQVQETVELTLENC